jgi:hypothetical protein
MPHTGKGVAFPCRTGAPRGYDHDPHVGATVSKSDDAKLAALIRKNAAKAEKAKKQKATRHFDDTLPPETTPEDLERREFFQDMKKREF